MKATTSTQIIAALPNLSHAELMAVKGAADALLGPQAAPNEPAATPLFAVIAKALGLRLGFATFQATQAYRQFKRGEATITAFVAEAFPNQKKPVEQALLTTMIDCLIDDLKSRHVPLSMGAVCSNLERAPHVFRDGFPGYIEGGHGQIIIDRLTRRKE